MITVHSLILGASHKCISGAVELTTPLLKLVDIIWLPLSRIYKLGYSYPRRLSRSPTVVGYHGADGQGGWGSGGQWPCGGATATGDGSGKFPLTRAVRGEGEKDY